MFKSTRQISGFGDTSRGLEENTGQGFAPYDRPHNDTVTTQCTHYVITRYKITIQPIL